MGITADLNAEQVQGDVPSTTVTSSSCSVQWKADDAIKKPEILDLLDRLPEEFDAEQLLYTLSFRHRLERAEADLAADRLTPDGEREGLPDLDRSVWEAELSHYRRKVEILSRALNNAELMEQVYDGIGRIKRGERGIPFRQIQEENRRRRESA